MTIVVTERPGLAGGKDSRQVTWYARDDAGGNVTPIAAVNAVLAEAPTTVDGFPYQNYRYDEIATDKFDVELNYSFTGGGNPPRDVLEGEAQYSFETTLESVKIYKSLGRQSSYFDSSLLPGINQAEVDALFPGALQVDAEDRVQGTTIQVPVTRFRYRFRVPDLTVTQSYQILVEDLTATVNDDTYKGRPAGSVRFDGANGTQSSDGTWDLDYRFTRRPNISDETIGGITGVNADGWDFVWPYFIPLRDGDGNITTNPAYVFVDRIYPRADLTELLIP